MIGILLMSHGKMAEGMLDSCKLFFGEDIPQIRALCLEPSDNPEEFDDRIRAAIAEIDDGQGIIAMCDLLGGTPCNRSAFVLGDRVQVITGMNFTMLLELLGKRMAAEDLNDVSIEELINVGKDGIVNLNAYFNQASEGDE
ncbi:MAG: PTS sugar transporter subunit IIA [Erysipelotrichaceae bacterium]|nr:PTS sugar transporter subunit IIA [Erysipelotrichaceae bacterium]